MNRFTTKADKKLIPLPRLRLIYFLCPLVLLIFMLGINSISETTVQKQKESLETALNRNIIHCYAVEGFYPPSLEYMEDNYGLTYDKDLFFVDYHPIGSNMRPDVTILIKQ